MVGKDEEGSSFVIFLPKTWNFFFFFCLFVFSYARATAMWDLSRICYLQHSSRQPQILNPLSEARDRTHNLMVPSRIH